MNPAIFQRYARLMPMSIPLVLVLIVFVRTIWFPFVVWDDPSHFLQNPLASHPLERGLRGLFWTREIGYPAPILLLSFALDGFLWKLDPRAYHAENVLLHLANVAMLFRLARRMRLSAIQACAVATIFAIHPLVVEPVSWVTGRKDVLSTAMVLGAVLLAVGPLRRARLTPAPRWVLANLLAMLAVLVLPRAVVASVAIVILVHAVRPKWSLRAVALRMGPTLPFALTIVALGAGQVKELGAVPVRSATDVALDVAGAWALQLGHLVWPFDLLVFYNRVPGDPSMLAMVVSVFVGLAGLAVVLLRAPPRSPSRHAAVLTIVAYAPVSCIFGIHRWTADSYMYFPLIAIGLAVVPLISRAWPPRLARFGLFASLALATVMALVSFSESTRWSSSSALWSGRIARYPDVALAYEQEAIGLLYDGNVAQANLLFIQIAERFPDWEDTLDDEVRAYEAIGDERRAREVLARGVRVGSAACVRMYWLRLIGSPSLPDPSERDLIAIAFREGFAPMKEGLRDAASFRRVLAILNAVGLDAAAAQTAAHLRELER